MKFKAEDYQEYNNSLGLYRYKDLHSLLEELFLYIPFDKTNLEDETQFEYDGMICFVEFEYNSRGKRIKNISRCELKKTGTLPVEERIKLHEKKLKQLKKRITQLKIGFELLI